MADTPQMPALGPAMLNLIGNYGHECRNGRNEVEITHHWLQLIAGIKDYAHTHAEQRVRGVLVQAEAAAFGVDEPPWTGYECPNTFQDGVSAATAAIRALAAEQKGQA